MGIEIKNLTYFYPETELPALQDINLTIGEGEFCAVVGVNNAGKSTLCYALSGFIPHFFHGRKTGKVLIDGQDTETTPLSELVLQVGLVFQNPFNQISGAKLTAYEEIAFGLENLGLDRQEMARRIEWALRITHMEDLVQRSPYTLSGGEQQRLAIASMLAMEPGTLILDEPTSQLDPLGCQEVFAVLRELNRRGVTVVMAEHKMERIAEFAHRIVVLREGKVTLDGRPGEVFSHPHFAESGLNPPKYTMAARRLEELGKWRKSGNYPVTMDQAEMEFRELLRRTA
jgi:energy-coupling factor transporter ATP-binding protein EcfA2